ncbi:ATP-binding protein [Thiomicrorhabdus aquaedulcis]|uniref:ATP-binding protein n=1 Tax=Thiomicrorhabdus aquaedulcis TaxID=2211106 RepID=UPI000FDC9087|nr:ATP-binding protein [Thiomicrorhabdus aquaedulcis]
MNTKSLFKQLIADFHAAPIRPLMTRDVVLPLDIEKIVVVTGMRRVGKTSLLLNAIETLRQSVAVQKILYLSFEDERLNVQAEDLDLILQAYRELYPELDLSQCYFFFDEIQEISGWEKFIRRLDDAISRHIYLTGSNSKLLSSEIATSLRGRCLSFEVFPLSFGEFLRFKNIAPDLISSKGRALIGLEFERYLIQGGFPELVNIESSEIRRKIIQDYYDVMLFRDVIERYQESNIPALKYFLKRVLESVSSSLSIAKIHNEMKSAGFKVGKNSLHDYLAMSEAVYFTVIASKFDPSIVRQTMAEKKGYIIDNGFLTQLSFRYQHDYGKLLENLVAISLRRQDPNVHFIKGVQECDFVLSTAKGLLPVQVAYDLSHPDTLARELKGLVKAAQFLNASAGIIVTLNEERTLIHHGINVTILSAWQFLLTELN